MSEGRVQFEKLTYTREFFKDVKLHSSFGLVQFRSSLENSLVHVFSKLHSKPYYYLYKINIYTHCSLPHTIPLTEGILRLGLNNVHPPRPPPPPAPNLPPEYILVCCIIDP